MGLNLRRERFDRWLEEYVPFEDRAAFLEGLERHVGQKIAADAWQIEDDAYPKVGSYTAYGVFLDCLLYVTEGDYQGRFDDEDELEREALGEFRRNLAPAALKIPYARHLLESDISDTIFIPLLYEIPFAFKGQIVASLPGAKLALEAFAAGLNFDLSSAAEAEFTNGCWLPIATARNIARILYAFFVEKKDACVAFV